MAVPSSDLLRRDIIDILKDADLATMSSKKVRIQLSGKYGCDLQSRKDEIDHIIMDIISQGPSNAASKSAASTSSKPTAKPSATKTTNSRNKKSSVADDDSSDDADNNDAVSDEEMNDDKGSDSDDNMVDDELLARKLQEEESVSLRKKTRQPSKRPRETKKKSEKSKDGVVKKQRTNKYMEPCILSPELAAVVGEPQLPRHEVVRRMWQIVRERNLADPKNKQYMICDDQLLKVFGRKKVRTFGMMKYLSEHITSPNSTTSKHQK